MNALKEYMARNRAGEYTLTSCYGPSPIFKHRIPQSKRDEEQGLLDDEDVDVERQFIPKWVECVLRL